MKYVKQFLHVITVTSPSSSRYTHNIKIHFFIIIIIIIIIIYDFITYFHVFTDGFLNAVLTADSCHSAYDVYFLYVWL